MKKIPVNYEIKEFSIRAKLLNRRGSKILIRYVHYSEAGESRVKILLNALEKVIQLGENDQAVHSGDLFGFYGREI